MLEGKARAESLFCCAGYTFPAIPEIVWSLQETMEQNKGLPSSHSYTGNFRARSRPGSSSPYQNAGFICCYPLCSYLTQLAPCRLNMPLPILSRTTLPLLARRTIKAHLHAFRSPSSATASLSGRIQPQLSSVSSSGGISPRNLPRSIQQPQRWHRYRRRCWVL